MKLPASFEQINDKFFYTGTGALALGIIGVFGRINWLGLGSMTLGQAHALCASGLGTLAQGLSSSAASTCELVSAGYYLSIPLIIGGIIATVMSLPKGSGSAKDGPPNDSASPD